MNDHPQTGQTERVFGRKTGKIFVSPATQAPARGLQVGTSLSIPEPGIPKSAHLQAENFCGG